MTRGFKSPGWRTKHTKSNQPLVHNRDKMVETKAEAHEMSNLFERNKYDELASVMQGATQMDGWMDECVNSKYMMTNLCMCVHT